jgi:tetratricopeptide (TPR) repeat protein
LALAGEIETPLATAGQILDLVWVHSTVARIRTARGLAATPDVRAFVEWTRGREFPDQSNSINVLDALACAHDSLGERDTALLLLRRIADEREAISSCPHYGLVLPAEVRMAVELEDMELARRLAAKTVASRAHDGHSLVLLSALESEQEGEYDRAAQRFAEAASRWHAFGAPYEAAQARLGQGRCLVALGRADDAVRPLRDAARVFRRLGAAPALAQTLRLSRPMPGARSRGVRG